MQPISHLLFRPTRYFSDSGSRPGWIIPFIIICVISMASAWLTLPFTERAVALGLSGTMGQEAAQQTAASSREMRLYGIAALPLERLLRWSIISLLVLAAVRTFSPEPVRFRTVFAVVISSQMIFAVMTILNTAVLHVRGVEAIGHSMDLNAILGLDVLIQDKYQQKAMYAALNAVNLFTIWHAAVLASGLAVTASLSAPKAYLISAGLWLLGTAFEVTMIIISQRLMAGVLQ